MAKVTIDLAEGRVVGQGILAIKAEGFTFLAVDESGNFGPSKSGKTTIVASSRGNVDLGDGLFAGVNLFRYIEEPTS